MAQWHETSAGRRRLEIEKAAVASRYPGFKLVTGRDNGIAWEGEFGKWKVRVNYPRHYPSDHPEAYILNWESGGSETRHIYGSGKICASPHGYDPSTNTAVVQICVAEQWAQQLAPIF